MALFIGIGAAYFLDALAEREPKRPALWTAGPAVEKTVGGQKLAIPPAWFQQAGQRKEGFADQVDLTFTLPLAPDGKMAAVHVVLLPNSRARTSATLLDTVYLHEFQPRQISGPPGLVGKPLKDSDGYRGETVWYDPLTLNPFVAKCMAPVAAKAAGNCMRTVKISKHVVATYVFSAGLLDEWKRFDTEAGKWLAKIGGLTDS